MLPRPILPKSGSKRTCAWPGHWIRSARRGPCSARATATAQSAAGGGTDIIARLFQPKLIPRRMPKLLDLGKAQPSQFDMYVACW